MTEQFKTVLHAWHAEHHGHLVAFGGWSMPVHYGSIVEEHQATRRAVGLFDVSHMGRLYFHGPDAGPYLDGLLTRSVRKLAAGRIRYSLMTNDEGGVLDDVLAYRIGAEQWMLVVNAGNRDKINHWLDEHPPAGGGVARRDGTQDSAMLAVQGPAALQCAATALECELAWLKSLKYFAAAPLPRRDESLVSRTGYTGEDGVELIVPADEATALWQRLVDAGGRPAGLGARDTLRLEAAMPLYGHELSESINPLEAGLEFAVNLSVDGAARRFVGCEALARASAAGPARIRIGLELSGRRVPREGYPVLCGGEPVGSVTSGTFSPTLERPIAMALVRADACAAGSDTSEDASAAPGGTDGPDRLDGKSPWSIDIRGSAEPARRAPLPFYQRSST